MPKTSTLQTSFAAGEISPFLDARRDTKLYRDGARSLRNNRLLIAGGAARRPGSRRLADITANGEARIEEFIVNQTTQYVLAFTAGRMDAYSRDTGTGLLSSAGNLTSCAWTGTTWRTMDFAASGNTIIVTHPTIGAWLITRTGASSWSKAAFPFYTDSAGRIHAPHYKLAAQAMTLTPSALTGSINLDTSASYWVAGHVGAHIRYVGKECVITSITSATRAVATVLEQLPGSQNLGLSVGGGLQATQFKVGDLVTGQSTGAKGEIRSINTGTNTIVVVLLAFGSSDKFQGGSGGAQGFSATEKIVGPDGVGTLNGVTTASPQAVTNWSEQLYSDLNGWPKCVEIHRGRVLFGGSAGLLNGVAGSSLANVYDFDIGDASDGNGFLETVGDAAAVQVVQMHSAEQLLLFTDKGPYYVPEGPGNAFRPSALAFYPFGGVWPCADVRAGAYDGGVAFVSGSSIIHCRPTGNSNALWEAGEVSFVGSHLVDAPVDSGFVTNFNRGPEHYGIFVNADGTLAVWMQSTEQQLRNFVPWDTTGTYKSVCSIAGDIYAVVARTISGSTKYWLERFDQDLTLDGVSDYADEAALTGISTIYGGETVKVIDPEGPYSLGAYPFVDPSPPDGPYQVGFDYTRTIETLPPAVKDGEGEVIGKRMRFVEAYVQVVESYLFQTNGQTLTAYAATDILDGPMPQKRGPQRFKLTGWNIEPTLTITQSDPLPLTVLGVRAKVAY